MWSKLLLVVGFVLAGLAVLWFAWLAPKLNQGRDQQAAARKIKGFKGIKTKWHGSVWGLHLTGIGDDELRQLVQADLPELKLLQISKSKLSDAVFAVFSKMPGLIEINLWGTPVSDAALEQLAKLPHLERLNLTNTGVEFKQVDKLQKSLKDTRIIY